MALYSALTNSREPLKPIHKTSDTPIPKLFQVNISKLFGLLKEFLMQGDIDADSVASYREHRGPPDRKAVLF